MLGSRPEAFGERARSMHEPGAAAATSSSTKVEGTRFDPFDEAFPRDPYSVYAHFLEHDRVHWGRAPVQRVDGAWYVFGHADVIEILREPRLVREPRRAFPDKEYPAPPEAIRAYCEMVGSWMLFRDPPDHTRLRSPLQSKFSSKSLDSFRPRIESIARSLLAERSAGEKLDFVGDYAHPLAFQVIGELIGIDPEDRDQFRECVDLITDASDMRTDMDVLERANAATIRINEYFEKAIEARREQPANDVLSVMLRAHDEGNLPHDELLGMCALLFIAGHETSVNTLGNSLVALFDHPSELERLRRSPELMETAVEELLRYDSTVQFTFRTAREDFEFRGREIRRGQMVAAVLAAANHDPEVFPEPQKLILDRPNADRHLALSHGLHYCLGAHLARLELGVALGTALEDFPGLRLGGQEPVRRKRIFMHGFERLDVVL